MKNEILKRHLYLNLYLSVIGFCFSFCFCFWLGSSARADEWFCREGASERQGSVLLACGVDTDPTENGARKKALAAAFEELDSICDRSVDCKTFELQIDPQ